MIVYPGISPNQYVELVMMRADGKVLQSKSIIPFAKGQLVMFDVRNMASGYYLIQVKQGGLRETKRVMIIR